MEIQQIRFVGSFPSERACPQNRKPEYAFIGRSNVGKSSLINMLCGRKELARTSKKPGKTQLINLFEIDHAWYLADLPGYGYAGVSKTQRKNWEKMIEGYMMFRTNLVSAFLLIDIRHPLQEIDREFMAWLGHRQVPFVVLFTKVDKVKKALQQNSLDRILEKIGEAWDPLPQWFVTSSVKGIGKDALLRFIAEQNAKVTNLKT